MPYLAGATSSSPHVNDFISIMTTFLTANGWALWDDLGPADKVFRSIGTGKERIFIRLEKNTSLICVGAYQYWDNIGHAGYNLAAGPGEGEVSASDVSAFSFFAWTDGRGFVFATKVGATYKGIFVGALDRIHDANIGASLAAVAAGVDVVVSVDQAFPTVWEVGKRVMILDQSTNTIGAGEIAAEHALVKAVTPNTVTLDLVNPFASGALIGVDPQPIIVTEGTVGIGAGANGYTTNNVLGWSPPAGLGPAAYNPFDTIIANADPDDRAGRLLQQPIYYFDSSVGGTEIRGKLPGIFVAPTTGVGNEDTTVLADGQYIALPIGNASRQIFVPTF